jgi:hypothetical protein
LNATSWSRSIRREGVIPTAIPTRVTRPGAIAATASAWGPPPLIPRTAKRPQPTSSASAMTSSATERIDRSRCGRLAVPGAVERQHCCARALEQSGIRVSAEPRPWHPVETNNRTASGRTPQSPSNKAPSWTLQTPLTQKAVHAAPTDPLASASVETPNFVAIDPVATTASRARPSARTPSGLPAHATPAVP